MNCPNCLSIMYCATEINNVADDVQRMDLHCYNDNCQSIDTMYKPHVGVIIRPNEIWKCYSYNLPYKYRDKWFCLKGTQHDAEWINTGTTQINQIEKQSGWVHIQGVGAYNKKGLVSLRSLVYVDFISISTGDDMHLEANKLFTRLINLVVFT